MLRRQLRFTFNTPLTSDISNNGTLGTNPKEIYRYLEEHGFKYEYTENQSEFESWAKKDRVFIIALWNGPDFFDGMHFVMLQSDENLNYTTYNYNTWSDSTEKYNLTDIIGEGSFICGYYLPKV